MTMFISLQIKGEFCHCILICWGIWEARNKKNWKDVNVSPRDVVRVSLAYLSGEGCVSWKMGKEGEWV